MNKIETLIAYVAARLSEPSTWQGISFILGLAGSKYAHLDWGQAAAIGASVSAALKILLPDAKAPEATK